MPIGERISPIFIGRQGQGWEESPQKGASWKAGENESVCNAGKQGNSLVQCEVKQKMLEFVGKVAEGGKEMLFPCQHIAGKIVKTLPCFGGHQAFVLSFPFSLTWVITKQSMLFLRKISLSFILKMSKQNVLAFLK